MNIIGKSECTASQMAQYLISKNPNAKSWALEYAQIYLEEGETEGVRGDGAWIQSCKETGNFKFEGGTAVTFDQNNFCGLGVTRKGLKGHSFETPRLGVRAQIQHLKGYATTTPLVNPCIDPRYKYVTKGCAPRFEDLAGKWAVPGYNTKLASSLEDAMNNGIGYGFDIIAGIEQMKKIVVNDSIVKDDNTTNTKNEGNKTYKIAVGAGHGSSTAGKRTPDNYLEHWINVDVADFLEDELLRCGFEVVKIAWDDADATDDPDVPLATRQAQVKSAKCDVSVSCHANAHGNGKVYTSGQGVETLIHNNTAYVGDSRSLAEKVQSYLIKGTAQKNRGVKTQSLAMCNCIAMGTKASILVEIGFMTNEYESALMKTQAFCLECAQEIAQGICEYFGVDYVKGSLVIPDTNTNTNNSSTTTPSTATTYTVVRGDTLSKIGSKVGIAWQTIAELNGIKPPYIIKIGQVLKLTNDVSNTTSSTTVPSSKYIYNGLDYSLVFDPVYYANKYSDLKKAFGTNATALWNHFKTFGMKEARMGNANFNVTVYKNRYVDLRKAFGDNLPEYYKHYIIYGNREGRNAK